MSARLSSRMRSILAVLVLIGPASARADIILDWNAEALDAVRLNLNVFDPDTNTGGDNPPRTSRALALTHAAIYDAVNSFEQLYQPYHLSLDPAAGASKEAAAVEAGFVVLSELFGSNALTLNRLNSRRNTHRADLADAGVSQQAINDGAALGQQIAAAILSFRQSDGGSNPTAAWPEGTDFGTYRTDTITPDAATPAAEPQWGLVTPWVLSSGSQFRNHIAGPPDFTSAAYAAAVNEARDLGDRRRYDATQYAGGVLPDDIEWQRRTAFFWAAKGLNADSGKNANGTVTPVGHWNQIAAAVASGQDLSLEEGARLFALLNMAQADAAVAAWDVKYHHNLWRPIHAIREMATDPGDPNFNSGLLRLSTDLDSDPNDGIDDGWMPLIPTSMHPEYVSGHSTFSGAAALILAEFFGTDDMMFTITGDDAIDGEFRTYSSFSEAMNEAGLSRIYGGIHYDFSNDHGKLLGALIGQYVLSSALAPVPEPGAAIGLLGLASLLMLRRRPRIGRNTVPAAGALALAGLVAGTPAHAAPVFTNVTASAGITHVHDSTAATEQETQTGGAAARDFDNDGWTDLFITRIGSAPILYRNLGDGTFADVTASAGLNINAPLNGAAWGDVDNDGHADLYVAGTLGHGRHYLFMNNGDGTFAEQAVARGADVPSMTHGYSAAFGDYDRDGFLDAHVSEWNGASPTAVLLRNSGASNPGTFTDVTTAAGVRMRPIEINTPGQSFSGRFSDLDGDGHPDLAVTSDSGTTKLFWNDGDGTFTDGTAAAGVGTGSNEMGSTIADYNGDGRLDWFVTSIQFSDGETGLSPARDQGNRLYRNEGNRAFSDRTSAAGVRMGGWGWGTTFLDFDNDGHRDIIMTNGYTDPTWQADVMKLWRNNGDGTFSDVSAASGITDTGRGQGLLSLDYDNDGDTDVFVVNNGAAPLLLRNDGGNAMDWLKVKLVGGGAGHTNRDGLGAWITVTPELGGPSMLWEMEGGSNYLSQNDVIAFFGLGEMDQSLIDLVTIRWTTGLTTELHDVSPNQLLTVHEVPEPSSAVVIAGAIAGLALRRRRR